MALVIAVVCYLTQRSHLYSVPTLIRSLSGFYKMVGLDLSNSKTFCAHDVMKDSASLISFYENNLSNVLAIKRQQESSMIRNSATLTLSYARAFYASNISQLPLEAGVSEMTIAKEKQIEKYIEDCALEYVEFINQNSNKRTSNCKEPIEDQTVKGSGPIANEMRTYKIESQDEAAKKFKPKFILDNGLDCCEISSKALDLSSDVTAVTPKFKAGDPHDNSTPYVCITAPSIGHRPLKTVTNLQSTPYTPENDSTKAQINLKKLKQDQRICNANNLQGRKRLNFSDIKDKNHLKPPSAIELVGSIQNCSENFPQNFKSENFSSKDCEECKWQKNNSDKCQCLSKNFERDDIDVLEYNALGKLSTKKKPTSCRDVSSRSDPYFVSSDLSSKKYLRSFVKRNFSCKASNTGTPPFGHSNMENSFLSPQYLSSKRLTFSEIQFSDNSLERFLMLESNLPTNNNLTPRKMGTPPKNISAKNIFAIENASQNIFKKNSQIRHVCEKIELFPNTRPNSFKVPSLAELCEQILQNLAGVVLNVKHEKKLKLSNRENSKREPEEIMDWQYLPPVKKRKISSKYPPVTPLPFMPLPSLGAPRKASYFCRISSPFCRRKLIKEFEKLQIEAELINTPPVSPNDRLGQLPLLVGI